MKNVQLTRLGQNGRDHAGHRRRVDEIHHNWDRPWPKTGTPGPQLIFRPVHQKDGRPGLQHGHCTCQADARGRTCHGSDLATQFIRHVVLLCAVSGAAMRQAALPG